MKNLFSLVLALIIGLGVGYALGMQQEGDMGMEMDAEEEVASMDVTLVNHIQLELPEQDVFIEMEDGKDGEVFRADLADAADADNLAKMVYASTEVTHHDPFKVGEDPLGPFEQGEELGFTLEEWLAGSGSGTYTVEDSKATMDLTFEALIPNGVYTMWCSRMKLPPAPAVTDLPCGALDGSENTFRADGDGNASYSVIMSPLQSSTESTVNVIAVAYHSDGQTYGVEPGAFGKVAHVQLAFIVPPSN